MDSSDDEGESAPKNGPSGSRHASAGNTTRLHHLTAEQSPSKGQGSGKDTPAVTRTSDVSVQTTYDNTTLYVPRVCNDEHSDYKAYLGLPGSTADESCQAGSSREMWSLITASQQLKNGTSLCSEEADTASASPSCISRDSTVIPQHVQAMALLEVAKEEIQRLKDINQRLLEARGEQTMCCTSWCSSVHKQEGTSVIKAMMEEMHIHCY
jgi:hypothetical protein